MTKHVSQVSLFFRALFSIFFILMCKSTHRRVKAHRRERRRIARNQRAYLVIATAYRKYRVRILLQCVVDFIRLKAFRFREQQMREEREFRMRTAMRRVREDSAMKEWQDEQTRVPTFPVKPTSPTAVRVDSFLQSIQKETIATIRKSRYLFNLGTSTQDKEALLAVEAARKAEKLKMATLQKAPAAVLKEVPKSEVFLTAEGVLTDSGTPRSAFASSTTPLPPSHAVAVPFTPAPPKKAKPVAAVKAVHKTAQQMHFDFHRPDLAPFSTHINNMIMAHSTYFQQKQQQQQQQKSALHADASSSSSSSWVDVASVGSDYLATFKKTKKSPAYCALEKFCGISQEEVIRSKLISHKEGVDMKLKSFGHSIVSL